MAQIRLNPEKPSDAGLAATYNAGLTTTDTFLVRNSGQVLLHVKKSGANPCTVSITPQPSFDETEGTVAITLAVKEGPVFHMGDLEFRGLDNGLTAKLRNAWKIRPGEVYNSTYLSEYLPAAQRLLPPTLDWEVSPHVTANVKDKTVDVDLIYSAKAPK